MIVKHLPVCRGACGSTEWPHYHWKREIKMISGPIGDKIEVTIWNGSLLDDVFPNEP